MSEWFKIWNDLSMEGYKYLKREGFKAADLLRGDNSFFDPKYSCGVIQARSTKVFPWLKKTIEEISGGCFRAWDCAENCLTMLKIFVQKGDEKPAEVIIESLLFFHSGLEENEWSIVSDQKQTKLEKGVPTATGQRVILVEASPLAWEYI